MSSQVENLCFQIGTENEFCPFLYTPELGPWIRVGVAGLLFQGHAHQRSTVWGHQLEDMAESPKGPLNLGRLLGINSSSVNLLGTGCQYHVYGQQAWSVQMTGRKGTSASPGLSHKQMSFSFNTLGLEGGKLQGRRGVVWKIQSHSTSTHLSCKSACKVGKGSLYQTWLKFKKKENWVLITKDILF